MRTARSRVAVLVVALLVLAGVVAVSFSVMRRQPPEIRRPQFTRPVSISAKTAYPVDVSVAFCTNGEQGDLGRVLESNPELASALAKSLAPFVVEEASGFVGVSATADYLVVGSETRGDVVNLYAHESIETSSPADPESAGGEWGPVRIRLDADSLAAIAVDRGGPSTSDALRFMPEWAFDQVRLADEQTRDGG